MTHPVLAAAIFLVVFAMVASAWFMAKRVREANRREAVSAARTVDNPSEIAKIQRDMEETQRGFMAELDLFRSGGEQHGKPN